MYVSGKIGFDAGPVPVDGVLGVRVTRTDSDLIGKSTYFVQRSYRGDSSVLIENSLPSNNGCTPR